MQALLIALATIGVAAYLFWSTCTVGSGPLGVASARCSWMTWSGISLTRSRR